MSIYGALIIDPQQPRKPMMSANHPGPGVSMAPGRNAAQIILADLGLDFFKYC
jgi:hypothetical protein